MVAVLGAAIAVRRAGATLLGPVLLVVGAAIFAIDHAAPYGPSRLVEGATVQNWKAALGALALAYPDRLATYTN